MKVAIVGAGIIGLSTAWALAREDHEVIVLDQGPIPNPASASFDQHRMIRPHYGNQEGYTRMVGEALGAWDLLWDDLDRNHYAETGVLAVDYGDHDWMAATRTALQRSKVSFDHLDKRDIERLAPMLNSEVAALGQEPCGLYAPRAGVLLADRILSDLAAWLSRKGAHLRHDSEVSRLDLAAGRLILADGEAVEADQIVVAVGAWVSRLLPDLENQVQSVRSVVGYVKPPKELAAAWTSGPSLFLMTAAAHLYCLPPVLGSELKFGGAPTLRQCDPDVPIEVSRDELHRIAQAFSPYLKDPAGHLLVRGTGGYYADPADKRFLIERQGRALIVTGCGGRMFKFGALVGQRLTQCLQGEVSTESLAQWARG